MLEVSLCCSVEVRFHCCFSKTTIVLLSTCNILQMRVCSILALYQNKRTTTRLISELHLSICRQHWCRYIFPVTNWKFQFVSHKKIVWLSFVSKSMTTLHEKTNGAHFAKLYNHCEGLPMDVFKLTQLERPTWKNTGSFHNSVRINVRLHRSIVCF